MWLYISVLCLQKHYSRYHISGRNLSDDQERHIKIFLWITLSVTHKCKIFFSLYMLIPMNLLLLGKILKRIHKGKKKHSRTLTHVSVFRKKHPVFSDRYFRIVTFFLSALIAIRKSCFLLLNLNLKEAYYNLWLHLYPPPVCLLPTYTKALHTT